MSYPLKNHYGDLFISIQVISKMKKNSVFYAGFTNTDEIFLSLIGNAFQTKLYQILANRQMRATQNEVVATMKLASVITTQRSYCDYITAAKQALPEFFGFEGVGILFFDKTLQELFTIDLNFSEEELEQMRKIAYKKKHG